MWGAVPSLFRPCLPGYCCGTEDGTDVTFFLRRHVADAEVVVWEERVVRDGGQGRERALCGWGSGSVVGAGRFFCSDAAMQSVDI